MQTNRCSMQLSRTVLLFFAVLITNLLSWGQVSIPVTFGSTPTCMSRFYSDILVPSGYSSNDAGAATSFANTPAGILGLTIYFEVFPYGEKDQYLSQGGGTGMIGIAETALNRASSIQPVYKLINVTLTQKPHHRLLTRSKI